jgi:hypothetical protein
VPASNTHECFSEFVGQEVVGVLFGAVPVGRKDIARGTKTLVFEDGRGLTISSSGSYWIDSAEDVQRAIRATKKALEATQRDLAGVLDLAGAA